MTDVPGARGGGGGRLSKKARGVAARPALCKSARCGDRPLGRGGGGGGKCARRGASRSLKKRAGQGRVRLSDRACGALPGGGGGGGGGGRVRPLLLLLLGGG